MCRGNVVFSFSLLLAEKHNINIISCSIIIDDDDDERERKSDMIRYIHDFIRAELIFSSSSSFYLFISKATNKNLIACNSLNEIFRLQRKNIY